MPTGTGAINLRNLPATKFAINPGLFNQLTSKNVFNPVNFPLPAYGNYVENQLLQVGIVSKLRLIVKGTLTSSGASVNITPTARYPWDLIGRFTLSGNGQNNFINCTGWDLRIRQIAANRAFVDGISSYPTSGGIFASAGSANFTLVYEVPVAMDDTTLVGALYAQSEATNLTYRLQTANKTDLFSITAGDISIDATVYLEETVFEVPYDPQKPDTLVIPDLTVLHGLVSNINALGAQTLLDTQLYRIQGQLERLIFRTFDPGSPASFVDNYDSVALIYGSNQVPYKFQPIEALKARMNTDYRVALPAGHYVLDFVAENPARDQVLLEGVTNLRLQTKYLSAPGSSSYVHFVQETLFA